VSRWNTAYMLSIAALLAAMSLAAAGLRLGLIAAPGVPVPEVGAISPRGLFVISFMPVWLVVAWLIAWAQKRRSRMRPSDDYRRVANRGLLAVTGFAALPHLWLLTSFVTGSAPGREIMVRACIVFVGLMFAVQGNFMAKSGPPTGEDAPSPGAWTRHVLRVGWAMVLVGVVMVICGFVLPFEIVAWTGLATVPVIVFTVHASRRRMRAAG
jgi:hypothetical protein